MINSNIQKKNIVWINIAKAICMLIVFWYHTEIYTNISIEGVRRFYSPFFVNTFFFLSGYLLFKKQLTEPIVSQDFRNYLKGGGGKSIIKNVLFKIAIPSIVFATIEFFPKKIIRGEVFDVQSFIIETIGGCTFWFTSALAVAELLLLLILLTRVKNIWIYVLTGLVISIFGRIIKNDSSLLLMGSLDFPWHYKLGMISLFYIALGGIFFRYENYLGSLLKRPVIIIFLVVVYSIIYRIDNQAVYMISASIGIFLIVGFCMWIPGYEKIQFIGRNSIGFYFLSGVLPNLYSISLKRIGITNLPVSISFVFCASVVTAYVIVFFITKYAPFLFSEFFTPMYL